MAREPLSLVTRVRKLSAHISPLLLSAALAAGLSGCNRTPKVGLAAAYEQIKKGMDHEEAEKTVQNILKSSGPQWNTQENNIKERSDRWMSRREGALLLKSEAGVTVLTIEEKGQTNLSGIEKGGYSGVKSWDDGVTKLSVKYEYGKVADKSLTRK